MPRKDAVKEILEKVREKELASAYDYELYSDIKIAAESYVRKAGLTT